MQATVSLSLAEVDCSVGIAADPSLAKESEAADALRLRKNSRRFMIAPKVTRGSSFKKLRQLLLEQRLRLTRLANSCPWMEQNRFQLPRMPSEGQGADCRSLHFD